MLRIVSSVILMLLIANVSASQQQQSANQQELYFNNLLALCGQSFIGKTVFPKDASDPFVGVELEIKFASCSEKEIRVPFRVGEDTSRTWVISKTSQGLLLKHDHRHKDGTPDEVTMYGGNSDLMGNALTQNFHADKATEKMIPAAKTNVWQLSFDQSKSRLTYYLERHAKQRYKAIFELKTL